MNENLNKESKGGQGFRLLKMNEKKQEKEFGRKSKRME